MSTKPQTPADQGLLLTPVQLDAETQKRIDALVEEDEGATHRLTGWFAGFLALLAIGSTLFHLYAAYDVVPVLVLRPVHVGIVLVLTFLYFPVSARFRDQVAPWDWALVLLAIVCVGYLVQGGDEFWDRSTNPTQTDFVLGTIFIVLILEATRRTTGIIMPIVCVGFMAYAIFGKWLGAQWGHRGKSADDLMAHLYQTQEGIFGSAIDVSSSLIILFTIFGAVLQHTGAGKFFIDFSFAAMGGRRNSAGRAVVLSSFLMGGPSGSGVATTVTIGTVAYPMLAKAGYEKAAAGGLLAAGGLGAIISPPVLGAAAFLIAEYLKISYMAVIWMATLPTILYYFGILVMVELDNRKYAAAGDDVSVTKGTLWRITKANWLHFGSLISIIAFMLLGFSPVLSVFWATMAAAAVGFVQLLAWPLALAVAVALSAVMYGALTIVKVPLLVVIFATFAIFTAIAYLIPKLGALEWPRAMVRAMVDGTKGVLSVAPTCAAAGIIVGVVTQTGLALKFADIIIAYAAGSLLLTTLYTAAIVWVVGLAVPVTASYILCAVIAAPALIKLGVPDYAAHMFIFYYAVLSEVSPPTALSPFAAAAITGANPYATTLQSWKYTMPAFLLPFMFVLDPLGVGLLLKIPTGGSAYDIVLLFTTAAIGIVFLAFAFQGRARVKNNVIEAALFLLGGLLLVMPLAIAAPLRNFGGFDLVQWIAGTRIGLNIPFGIAVGTAGLVVQQLRALRLQPATV